MARDQRQKASDVFREANYPFAEKVGFKEAFPQIAKLNAIVEQKGYGVADWNRTQTLGKGVGEFVDCANPICYRGGFSLGNILRQMVRDRQTHQETTAVCQGYEGSPKGRRRYRSCINSFRITVDIEYRQDND